MTLHTLFQTRAIRYRMLKWFLLTSLVPLLAVTYLFHTISDDTLRNNIQQNLLSTSINKVHEIESLAAEMKRDISFLALSEINISKLETVNRIFQDHGVESSEYKEIEKTIEQEWRSFITVYGYYDLMLISDSGDITFSVTKDVDFGTNLYTGPYHNTIFSDTFRHVKTSHAIEISDYRYYAPSNRPSLFIVAPFLKQGKFIGAIAVQADPKIFQKIISDYTGLGNTGETLIGSKIQEEAVFIFSLRNDPDAAFKRRIKIGSDKAVPLQEAVQGKSGSGMGIDYRGEKIEAVWRYIPSFRWGLVSKIDTAEAYASLKRQNKIFGLLVGFSVILVIIVVSLISRSLSRPLTRMAEVATKISKGDLDQTIETSYDGEIGVLAEAFQQMLINLKEISVQNEHQIWQSRGQTEINNKIRGEQDIQDLAANTLQGLCQYIDAQVGTLSVMADDCLRLTGTYAYMKRKNVINQYQLGEGLIGQAALEKKPILLTQVPEDYISIHSSLGETPPTNLFIIPFIYEGKVLGVIEIGSIREFTQPQLDFVQQVMENIAIAFHMARDRDRMQELLEQSQLQTEEIQSREESLRVTNEELTAQTEALKRSEVKLKQKQTELENANTELEEQAAALQASKTALLEKQVAVDKQNRELILAQVELKRKAEELELTSKYKSEFLANMSHELRTPLNSLLILARTLMENKEQNLSDEQVECARIIYNGGNELLELINEILDLSKIEAGKMKFHIESVPLSDILSHMERQFMPVAEQKGLTFKRYLDHDLPRTIQTDRQRVEQIIKNLLSNAFKFTEQGSVRIGIARPADATTPSIAFSVSDTGIGISEEHQKIIFEAFQQADGSTSRKYGGTGLGLSISRELAKKLGGQIFLESTPGKGSTFTLILPDTLDERQPEPQEQASPKEIPAKETMGEHLPTTDYFPDDRNTLQNGDRTLLVIEDDLKFAKILYNTAHHKQFKCIVAGNGKAGLKLACDYKPTAITLDMKLPDMNGWDILAELKINPDTRHIPVHIISVEDETLDAYKKGAIGYLTKPTNPEGLDRSFQRIESFIDRKIRSLLIVEDDDGLRGSIRHLLEGNDLRIMEAPSGKNALDLLRSQNFDCMILDLRLPDISGFDLLNEMDRDAAISKCPVIVYTGKDLTEEENERLMLYADSVIIKGAKSPERLLDETALFLHRVLSEMPQDKQNMIKQLYDKDSLLAGKKILIVDDDMRNSFALSKLLSDKGVEVRIAGDGQKSLDMLDKEPDINLVLMDIMMPVMDGHEAIKRIREHEKFQKLPILALTAKAMQGDREKCIQAGANDYLTKPVDPDRLFSMLRVWLYS